MPLSIQNESKIRLKFTILPYCSRYMDMHLISWNVNGLRAVLKKDALAPVFKLAPDILCLQETKAANHDIPELELMDFPYRYFHEAEKRATQEPQFFLKLNPLT